jgi:disulfide oxidoreductase YuzD
MDPITAAIMAVVPALASDVVKASVKDAYEGLKEIIRRKYAPVATAVEAVEANPKSKGQVAVLAEHVADTKATTDADIMQALAKLLDEMKKAGIGGKATGDINIDISGGTVQGVVGAQSVSIGSMSFGAPPKDGKS